MKLGESSESAEFGVCSQGRRIPCVGYYERGLFNWEEVEAK